MKKTLCIDGRMALSSGIGTVIQNFFHNFNDEFSLSVIGNTADLELILRGKVDISIIQSTTPIYSIKEQLELPRLIPRCDLFWSPHYNIPLLPIKAKRRVVTIHDVYHLAFMHEQGMAQRVYASTVFRQAVTRSQKVITVSGFSQSEIIKHLGERTASRINVIYPAVDHDLFRVIPRSEQFEARTGKYNLPSSYILCVGNVKPHKNLRRLVEAVKLIGDDLSDTKLVVVGRKEGFITGDSQLFQMIENDHFLSQRVVFTGFVSNEDLPYLYNMASLFVFPSYYEGFGLPPLEAMACGCPVVASHAASIPEICGDAVRYFDPYDVKDMATKIGAALSSNENAFFRQKGIDRAKQFLWKRFYDGYLQLFRSM